MHKFIYECLPSWSHLG